MPLSESFRLNDAIDHQVWFLRVFGKVFLTFALIAMLMASVGIYAVVAHATNSRTQEIGVRVALGATGRNILLLVMRRGLWQVAVGLAVGLAAAFPLAGVMASIGLRSDPFIFCFVAFMMASVGVFACWLPARLPPVSIR